MAALFLPLPQRTGSLHAGSPIAEPICLRVSSLGVLDKIFKQRMRSPPLFSPPSRQVCSTRTSCCCS